MKKQIKIIINLVFVLPLLVYSNNDATKNDDTFIVVLDAGHGGKDPGAIGKKAKEKDLALAITLKAGEYIEENLKDVKVIYTRTTDVFVPLIERSEIANKHKAHLFLSVHVNANGSSSPYGTSSHVMGLHQTEANLEVAKKENSVILLEEDYETTYENFDPNSPESYIIFSVMQNTYQNQSIEMAALIQDQFKSRARRKDRGVERQPLLVLKQCSMPGVLIETGFITNPKEEVYLMSVQGQEYIASAIYRAVKVYSGNIRSKSNFTGVTTNEQNPEKVEMEGIQVISKKELENINDEEENQSHIPETWVTPATSVKNDDVTLYNVADAQKSGEKDTGIVFRIQISSSYAKLDKNSGFFKNIQDVEFYETEGLYKYVTGNDPSYDKIKARLGDVRKDFPDAFIIAVKKGVIIPLQQAFKETNLKNNNIN